MFFGFGTLGTLGTLAARDARVCVRARVYITTRARHACPVSQASQASQERYLYDFIDYLTGRFTGRLGTLRDASIKNREIWA
jgi:hypothetical protein